jgi:hypothetical protein
MKYEVENMYARVGGCIMFCIFSTKFEPLEKSSRVGTIQQTVNNINLEKTFQLSHVSENCLQHDLKKLSI